MELLLDIPNACSPMPGVVSGGQPGVMDFEAAKDKGMRTVVDLCSPHEHDFDERELVESIGMNYVNIPVAGAAGMTRENADKLAAVLDDRERYPMLVHCGSGNRVGALFALKAFYTDGCDVEKALEVGRSAGLRAAEGAVRAKLESE